MSVFVRNRVQSSAIIWFISGLIFIVSSGALCRASTTQPCSRVAEVRAVWMDRRSIPNTEAGIRSMVRRYSSAGINVLFPEAIFNGCSAYPSSYLSRQDLWDGLDVLAVLTDEAHKQGMEVHPWVWVFRVGYGGDRGGLLPRYPQWEALDEHGNSDPDGKGLWMSPCSAAARRLLVRAICELARMYPVDGIHLDYVRFPGSEYGYEAICRSRFESDYGKSPQSIRPFTADSVRWQEWREECVNAFVSELSHLLQEVRPGAKLSASVGPTLDQARLNYLQNWEHWVANRWVDFVCPMAYTPDTVRFRRILEQTKAAVGDRTVLVPGIGLHLHKSPERVLEQIDVSRSLGTAGIALFSSSYLDAEITTIVGDRPFCKRAEIPLRRPRESASKLAASAAKELAKDNGGCAEEAADCLRAASSLIEYAKYREADSSFVPSKPPPMFVPEEVEPTPEVEVPKVSSAPIMDGCLTDSVWDEAATVRLEQTQFGCPGAITTTARLVHDGNSLFIAGEMPFCPNHPLRAEVIEHDGAVFVDDSFELFISRGAGNDDYFHFALNSLAARYDALVYDVGFSPVWEIETRRSASSWSAEIRIPLSSLGVSFPTEDSLRANFCRNRISADENAVPEHTCWSPTYGSFHTPIRFGSVRLIDGRVQPCPN